MIDPITGRREDGIYFQNGSQVATLADLGGGSFDILRVPSIELYYDIIHSDPTQFLGTGPDATGWPLGIVEMIKRYDAIPAANQFGTWIPGATPNFKPAIYLPYAGGISTQLEAAYALDTPLTDFTVMYLAKAINPSATSYLSGDSSGTAAIFYFNGSGNFLFYNGADLDSGMAADTDWHLHTGIIDSGGADKYRIDGVEVASGNAGSNTIDRPVIGGYGPASGSYDVQVNRYALFSSILSGDDLDDVESFLMTDAGL